jgi:hypothetical protein
MSRHGNTDQLQLQFVPASDDGDRREIKQRDGEPERSSVGRARVSRQWPGTGSSLAARSSPAGHARGTKQLGSLVPTDGDRQYTD